MSSPPTSKVECLPSTNHQLARYTSWYEQINITFDDITQKFRYEVKNYAFEKINYKTVVAALKNTHPNIISAAFTKNEGDVHVLTVKVAYEYLPEIQEQLIFEKREIPAEE